MITQLPHIANDTELDALMADAVEVSRCLDYAAAALGVSPVSAPVRGSALVGMNESSVIKLMAPTDSELAAVEHACLSTLEGALPIATPRLLDSGTLDGWRYVHMTRLPGVELKECWPTLSHHQKRSLAVQLGECLPVLHGLPAPREIPRCDWPNWVADRLAVIPEREHDAPPGWAEALPEMLDSTDLSAGEQGWLHTEIMLEHLLVQVDGDRVGLSGLFDFEPSWVGPVHYEYAAVATCFSAGDASVLADVLRAAGQTVEPERLFAMAVMHRYANLAWYRRRLGGPEDLHSWIQTFFGVAAG